MITQYKDIEKCPRKREEVESVKKKYVGGYIQRLKRNRGEVNNEEK